ncbi:MAG TPA: hypothetical protein VN704_11135 [Verrucomicrobiae bacterium]|nr:hypothetical protein [Verrucomicrobiae bacterium]
MSVVGTQWFYFTSLNTTSYYVHLMKLMTSNPETMKKTSAIVLAIFAVVAISALAFISASEDASAFSVRHGSIHHNGHSAHGTCVRVHGHVRCHGHGH